MSTLAFKNLLSLSVETNPGWGMYIHLCRAIRGTGISRRKISYAFNKYMPEEEFDIDEKPELIDYLEEQSLVHDSL